MFYVLNPYVTLEAIQENKLNKEVGARFVLLSSSWSRSWSLPGPNLVLPWTYLDQVPFLVKTGPGVDTIIKKTTTPLHHKLFVKLLVQVLVLAWS